MLQASKQGKANTEHAPNRSILSPDGTLEMLRICLQTDHNPDDDHTVNAPDTHDSSAGHRFCNFVKDQLSTFNDSRIRHIYGTV